MWYSLSADSHTHTSSTTVMFVDVTSVQLKASVSTLFTGWSDIYGSVSVEAMLVMSQWVEVTAITTTERRRRAAISTSSFNAARTLNLSRTWMSWNRLWASARLAPVPGRAGLNILIFVHFVQNCSSLWRRTWRVAAHRLNITRG